MEADGVTDNDLQSAIDRARARARAGAEAAAGHAEAAVLPDWTARAVGFVRLYALTHRSMRCEHVRIFAEVDGFPAPPDKRAWGHAMQRAVAEGVIAADGFEAAVTSNGSPKVKWKSLLFTGYREDIE
jgi:hypothetical protein